ncbi:hypothetical protein CLV51_104396 [Chitinophaga niastensis]|uniref:Uncharacterized protein n=1 Tax=Chitinophaga niastensis TaxID=536980 RepID=A0A2P8HHL7_CHINA|nr:hypothetical protein CLV51_104396 [Chitinophaga niastensis]
MHHNEKDMVKTGILYTIQEVLYLHKMSGYLNNRFKKGTTKLFYSGRSFLTSCHLIADTIYSFIARSSIHLITDNNPGPGVFILSSNSNPSSIPFILADIPLVIHLGGRAPFR